MVAGKITRLQHGGDRSSGQLAACPTQEQAAEMLNVGERSVRRAREVLDEGVPELIAAANQGRVTVSAASDVAKLPKVEQLEPLSMVSVYRNRNRTSQTDRTHETNGARLFAVDWRSRSNRSFLGRQKSPPRNFAWLMAGGFFVARSAL
jgi:hypothetical protein